jgi:hypothetical protein
MKGSTFEATLRPNFVVICVDENNIRVPKGPYPRWGKGIDCLGGGGEWNVGHDKIDSELAPWSRLGDDRKVTENRHWQPCDYRS